MQPANTFSIVRRILLADLEHLGPTDRAGSLGRRLSVLHRDFLRVLHLPLSLAFYAIGLH